MRWLLACLLLCCGTLSAHEESIEKTLCKLKYQYRRHHRRAQHYGREAERVLSHDKLFYRVYLDKAWRHWRIACQYRERIEIIQEHLDDSDE